MSEYPRLSEEVYFQTLRNKFNIICEDIKLESAKWLPLSKNILGYLADHYILKLNFTINEFQQEDSVFVKVYPTKPYGMYFCSKHNYFKKETTFYSEILKEFQRMNFRIDFASQCYYVEDGKMIVLENMIDKDYKRITTNFFDMDHCMVVMKSLATLHANSFALEESKSIIIAQEYPSVKEEVLFTDNDLPGKHFIEAGRNAFLSLCDLLPESEEWRNIFRKKLINFDVRKEFLKPLPSRKTLTHGDLWSNNLLFKYLNGKPVHCCLVDYQFIRYYHPSFDVILTIYFNTRKSLRDKFLTDLLGCYYDNFEEMLKQYGYEAHGILSRSDFLKGIEACKALAFFQVISLRTFYFLPKADGESTNGHSNNTLGLVVDKDARGLVLVEHFEKDEEFRKIIIEDAHELFHLL